jgi:hypothetical protein
MNLEIPFSDDQEQRLREVLPRGKDATEMAALIARAGAREALAQATGTAVFSSIADLRAFRIYCLVESGMTLDEAEAVVAALFKVPSSTAKRWVNGAVARYLVELQAQVGDTIRGLLADGGWDTEAARWKVRVPSVFVRDRIADVLAGLDVPEPEPARRGSIWRFADETFQALRVEFSLEEQPPPNE